MSSDISAETTRQRIRDFLERSLEGASPSRVVSQFDRVYDERIDVGEVLSHIEHLRHSQEHTGWHLEAIPPSCMECSYDGFDDIINIPSSCPECNSSRINEPIFNVVSEE